MQIYWVDFFLFLFKKNQELEERDRKIQNHETVKENLEKEVQRLRSEKTRSNLTEIQSFKEENGRLR